MSRSVVKVALVDDSSVIRNSIHEIISLWGYEVVLKAVNGRDLFAQLTPDSAPDICITDINMPVMNGFETIAELKANWPDVRIIAFSISNNKREEERAVEAGAHAFVSKVGPITELKKVLRDNTQPVEESGC